MTIEMNAAAKAAKAKMQESLSALADVVKNVDDDPRKAAGLVTRHAFDCAEAADQYAKQLEAGAAASDLTQQRISQGYKPASPKANAKKRAGK